MDEDEGGLARTSDRGGNRTLYPSTSGACDLGRGNECIVFCGGNGVGEALYPLPVGSPGCVCFQTTPNL